MQGFQLRVATILIGLISPLISNAQCENPVGLDEVLAGIETGYTIDPSLPQAALSLASQGESVRGFIDVERPEVVSQQCETDYFYLFEFIGSGNVGTYQERLDNMLPFRARLRFEFSIDGVPAVLLDTEPADGFSPYTHPVSTPMAYLFTGAIFAPGSFATWPAYRDNHRPLRSSGGLRQFLGVLR